MAAIHAIYNANVYLDGRTQIGRAGEIKLPDLELEMDEYKALGIFGSFSAPMGMKELEGEVNWNSLYPDALSKILQPFRFVQLQSRSNLVMMSASGVEKEVRLVTLMNVQFFKSSPGTYKPKERSEHPSSFKCNSIKQLIDGKEVLFYDVLSNQYRVDGIDILAAMRGNMGA